MAATLNLEAAAQFLGLHPNTLQARAKAGEIPGAKVGKEWRFLDIDLIAHLRAQYPANRTEEPCHSTSVAKRGGMTSRSMDSELENLLGRKIARKRSASMTR